jgi:hypothetical protein
MDSALINNYLYLDIKFLIMKKILIILFCFSNFAFSQTLSGIFTNIDTLFIPGGSPGSLSPISINVYPIVSSNPCYSPLQHFVVASQYQNGRVLAIGHEGLLVDNNINQYDNSQFVLQAINWLDFGSQRVTLKEGYVNNGNTSMLQNMLINNGFTVNTLSGNINSASLLNTDILILGNDWNQIQPYSSLELASLDIFVANGGSVLIAGLGWSWPQALNLYPMNQVANLFGFEFTTNVINDPNNNLSGSPKFYNFYPDNLDTNLIPYCSSPYFGANFERGDTLRLLRLAVSTNGEFTQQNGGATSIPLLLENWIEIINKTYGREYSVRFEIIPNNNQLIFPDSANDPWQTLPAGSGGCTNAWMILDDQARVIDSIIGQTNYDISHVIVGSPFGGGCAGGLKVGVSGGLNISVTRHEIGHQLKQSHTIAHSNNSNYEPENGNWTIQGGNQHGYAHGVSFHQLSNFLKNIIPEIGHKVSTGNNIPSVNAGQDYTIPITTPFTLTASSSDLNSGDTLTYVWDNMSPGPSQYIPLSNDKQGAIFMRLLPDTISSRTFPQLSDVIVNNNSNTQEQLPTQSRIMDFRLTVNDNHKMTYNGQLINSSGINSDDVRITIADSGPFIVTSQMANGLIYQGGSIQLVTWDVNGTDTLPVNTQYVSIMLSIDGGYTFPFSLLQSTSNNGSAYVTLPNLNVNTARIKVQAVNNIYFDLNLENFQILATLSSSDIYLNSNIINIFPNPSRDIFNIRFTINKVQNLKFRVLNVLGEELISENLEQFIGEYTKQISLDNYGKGIYFLEIETSTGIINKKLILQ